MSGVEPALVFKILGFAMSAIGQIQAGIDTQNAANFNAQVAYNNAHAARLAGLEKGMREKRLAMKRAGTNRAHDPDKMDLLENTAMEEELAFQSIIHAGEVQATGFENTARLDISKGKAAKRKGFFDAAGTVLMGGAKAFGGAGVPPVTTTPGFGDVLSLKGIGAGPI